MSRTTSSGRGVSTVKRMVPLDSSKAASWSRTESTTRELHGKMLLRGEKGNQGFLLVLQRGHPIARALFGVRHQIHHKVPDVLECGSRGNVEAAEVVVHR
jgi:hypothetical protein